MFEEVLWIGSHGMYIQVRRYSFKCLLFTTSCGSSGFKHSHKIESGWRFGKYISGISLNNFLIVELHMQRELFLILLRFRTLPIVVCADLEKMFWQVLIIPEEGDFMRILWRESSRDSLEEYRLIKVTHGTGSAPFNLLQLFISFLRWEDRILLGICSSVKEFLYRWFIVSGDKMKRKLWD